MSEIVNEIKSLGDQFKAETKKIEEKHAADVAQLNEDLAKKGNTLAEIKESVEKMTEKLNEEIAKKARGFQSEAESFKDAFAKELEVHFKDIQKGTHKFKMNSSFDTKAVADMTIGAHLTGSAVATYNLNPAVRGRRKAHFRDLVEVIPSATGIWKFYQQNSTAGEGSFGVQTEGAAKAQIDYDNTEKTVNVAVLAGFSRISAQMLRDLPFMQSFLPNELQEDYFRSEDNKFINDLMATCAAYTTTATVYAEKIIEWLSVILSRDYNPTNVVTTATNWATLLSTKPNDYSIPGGVTITANGEVAVAGVPVSILNGMTGTKTFVGDFSRVKIIQSAGLNIRFFEQDADNVTKNLVTVRAEAEVALAALRTDAMLYV